MKLTRIFVPLFFLCFAAPAHALVLRGVVSEVRDGESIIVSSGGRKLAVLLKGVDAPELKQEFGNASREHLARLILEKSVDVEFTQLESTHVVAKVTCNQLDIGLQVIRDGSAWYDRTALPFLNEGERLIYPAAEEAARNELRGLWQDGSPMPPWEWRRAETAKEAAPVTYKSGSGRAFQTEDILFTRKTPTPLSMPAGAGPGSVLPKPTAKPLNAPGQDVDFRAYLNQGRVSIVYFYADWCPACRRLTPLMEQINAKVPDVQVLFMDIDSWNTAVTQQYGVTSVPHLKIYDKSGKLVAEGRSARDWLDQMMRSGGR